MTSVHHEADETSSRPRTSTWTSKLAGACATLALLAFGFLLIAGGPAPTSHLSPASAGSKVAVTVEGDAASTAGIRPCDAIGGWRSLRSVTCTTNSATLTIVRRGGALTLGDVEARVLRTDVISAQGADQPRMAVRMRIRNQTSGPQVVNASGNQIYLVVGRTRLRAAARTALGRGEVSLGSQQAVEETIEFELDERARLALRSSRGNADLGVLPFAEVGSRQPVRYGVLRVWASIRDAVIAGA